MKDLADIMYSSCIISRSVPELVLKWLMVASPWATHSSHSCKPVGQFRSASWLSKWVQLQDRYLASLFQQGCSFEAPRNSGITIVCLWISLPCQSQFLIFKAHLVFWKQSHLPFCIVDCDSRNKSELFFLNILTAVFIVKRKEN